MGGNIYNTDGAAVNGRSRAADAEPCSVNSINRNFHSSGAGGCSLSNAIVVRLANNNFQTTGKKVSGIQIFIMSAKYKTGRQSG